MSINDISTLSPEQIDTLFEIVLKDLDDAKEKTLRNDELSSLERAYSAEINTITLIA